MTNRTMVKTEETSTDAAPAPGPSRTMPEPNPAPPQLMPAAESDPVLLTDKEPLDSPQPKPMIEQGKAHGLKTS